MNDGSREIQNEASHVGQSGTEVLVDVSFQDRIEVLEFYISNKCDYENLVIDKRRKPNQSKLMKKTYSEYQLIPTTLYHISIIYMGKIL